MNNIDFTNPHTYRSFLNNINVWNTYYKTERPGPTGIGKTWETLNQVDENNSTGSDLKGLELKAKRATTKSPLSMFTLNPVCSMGGPVIGRLVDEYGKPHRNRPNDLSLHKTMRVGEVKMPNGYMVELACDSAGLTLRDNSGATLAHWSVGALSVGVKKIETMALAYADVRGKGEDESFRYRSVIHYSGLNMDRFLDAMVAGFVVVEFRAAYNNGVLRDRGTGFRIAKKNLSRLYQNTHVIR